MEGTTVLYIPKEGSEISPAVGAKNKELVQRLESASIGFALHKSEKIQKFRFF
jgi:hypothetical protein